MEEIKEKLRAFIQEKFEIDDDRSLKNSKASLGTVDDIEEGCDIFLRMDREWIYDIVVYKN